MRRPGFLLTIAIAWVGVVAGHASSYVLTYPANGLRHTHLAVTGHTWLGLAAASLIALIPVILLAIGMHAARSSAPWSGPRVALLLTAIQVPAFAAIESMERGWSVGEALSDPAVFVGLMLQPLLAVVATWALELLRRTVQAMVDRRRTLLREHAAPFPPPASGPPSTRYWLLWSSRRRAPPALLHG